MNDALDSLAFSAVAALALAVILRHFGIQIALPLIAAGAVLSLSPWGPDALSDPEIVLIVILAPLVFGDALSSSFLDLRKVSRQVLLLAVGLVIATILVVGGVAVWVAAMPLAAALALGAVLAPTDAVAVSTVAKKASLPRFVISILEGESLVNDGTGLTALRVAVAAAIMGSVTLLDVGEIFALAVVVGVGIGAVSGIVLSQVLRRTRDSIAGNGLVLVAPFAIYLATEALEGSGSSPWWSLHSGLHMPSTPNPVRLVDSRPRMSGSTSRSSSRRSRSSRSGWKFRMCSDGCPPVNCPWSPGWSCWFSSRS